MRRLPLHPVYLLAGGGPRGRSAYSALLARIIRESGAASPAIAYVGAASGDHRGFFRMIAGLLTSAGAGKVRLAPTAGKGGGRAPALRVLNSADIVFISGGDVEAGMRVLAERDLVGDLKRLQRAGVPFVGLSAGSIMLARAWVRWRDPRDESSAEVFPCLGLAPVLCDTHAEEDDWAELHALLGLLPNGAVGYGIPAGGALKVMPDGKVEAIGAPAPRFVRRKQGVVPGDDLATACA
jgi:cyanophycinase-like exopeptidase